VLAFLVLLLIGHHAVTRPSLTTPRKPPRWPVAHHPQLAHFLPYLTGDSLAAIRRAGRLRRLGRVWGIDQNGNRTADRTAWILHWGRWRLQYPFVATGRVTATGREIRALAPRSWPRHFSELTDEQAARLRQLPAGGRRPHRARVHMEVAAQQNVPWCLEGKGRFHGVDWDRLTADAVETGVVAVFMVLTSWPDWRADVREAAARGWAVAVLPRTPRPADWAEFHALGVQVWGSWR
jgi:hypothetical protein